MTAVYTTYLKKITAHRWLSSTRWTRICHKNTFLEGLVYSARIYRVLHYCQYPVNMPKVIIWSLSKDVIPYQNYATMFSHPTDLVTLIIPFIILLNFHELSNFLTFQWQICQMIEISLIIGYFLHAKYSALMTLLSQHLDDLLLLKWVLTYHLFWQKSIASSLKPGTNSIPDR